MSALIERLQALIASDANDPVVNEICREAAAEIERLTRLNEAGWKDLKEKHVEIERLEKLNAALMECYKTCRGRYQRAAVAVRKVEALLEEK